MIGRRNETPQQASERVRRSWQKRKRASPKVGKLTFSKFSDEPYATNEFTVHIDGKEVGVIFHNSNDGGEDTEFIEYIGVDSRARNPQNRNRGYGSELLRKFAREAKVAGKHYIAGELTSQGIFRFMTRVLGKPEYVADDVNEYSGDEIKTAVTALPKKAEEAYDKETKRLMMYPQTSLFVRWKI